MDKELLEKAQRIISYTKGSLLSEQDDKARYEAEKLSLGSRLAALVPMYLDESFSIPEEAKQQLEQTISACVNLYECASKELGEEWLCQK